MYKISVSAVFFLLLRRIVNDYDEYDPENDSGNGTGAGAWYAHSIAAEQ